MRQTGGYGWADAQPGYEFSVSGYKQGVRFLARGGKNGTLAEGATGFALPGSPPGSLKAKIRID